MALDVLGVHPLAWTSIRGRSHGGGDGAGALAPPTPVAPFASPGGLPTPAPAPNPHLNPFGMMRPPAAAAKPPGPTAAAPVPDAHPPAGVVCIGATPTCSAMALLVVEPPLPDVDAPPALCLQVRPSNAFVAFWGVLLPRMRAIETGGVGISKENVESCQVPFAFGCKHSSNSALPSLRAKAVRCDECPRRCCLRRCRCWTPQWWRGTARSCGIWRIKAGRRWRICRCES